LNEFVGVFYVRIGRLDLPAWVVVADDHLGGIFQNRDSEHVRWMNGGLGNAAKAYEFEKQQTVIVLHADDPEMFLAQIEILLPLQHVLHDGEHLIGICNLDFLGFG